MRIRTLLKPLSFVPALLLMYMIFQFSGQEAQTSTDLSYKVSHRIVSTANYLFDTGLDEYQIDSYAWRINGVTRKLAHMTEYFLLAIAVSFPLYVYGLRGILLVIVAGGICVAYACADEYHQSFVSGRAASWKDVGIDSFGILVGIILVRIIGWTGRHTLFLPSPDERYEKMSRKELKRYQKRQMQALKQDRSRKHSGAGYGEPGHGSPGYDNRGYGEPVGGNPGYDSQRYGEPGYGNSAYDNRGYSEPGYGNSAYDNRGYSEPGYGSPGYGGQVYNGQDYGRPGYDAREGYGPGYDDRRGYAPENDTGRYYDNRPYENPHYRAPEEEASSDELSDDIPFSRFFKPR